MFPPFHYGLSQRLCNFLLLIYLYSTYFAEYFLSLSRDWTITQFYWEEQGIIFVTLIGQHRQDNDKAFLWTWVTLPMVLTCSFFLSIFVRTFGNWENVRQDKKRKEMKNWCKISLQPQLQLQLTKIWNSKCCFPTFSHHPQNLNPNSPLLSVYKTLT